MRLRAQVWTASTGLLSALATLLLQQPVLEDLTVLVPTRRAARALSGRLREMSGKRALVLPRIRPIGDEDEDLLQAVMAEADLLPALSPVGQVFLLQHMLLEWARQTPQHALARDVLASGSQALGLAQSLSALFSQSETEEIELSATQALFDMDLAQHREAMTSLLSVVAERMPMELQRMGYMSAARRRNQLIRLEAARIDLGLQKKPIIAAGSTGTNPATRALLKAISAHSQNHLVLPGLDHSLPDDAFLALDPQHPQYAFKILLQELSLLPSDVEPLPSNAPLRSRLIRETFRPASQSEKWRAPDTLNALTQDAVNDLSLLQAPDRHLEARAIAVLMREVVEHPQHTAALVTPDRDLAQRVTAELSRWNIAIDDSAGQPLLSSPAGQVFEQVLMLAGDGFSTARLAALLHNPFVTCGVENFAENAALLDLTLLRAAVPAQHFTDLVEVMMRLRQEALGNRHGHRSVQAMDEETWTIAIRSSSIFQSALSPLANDAEAPFQQHLERLQSVFLALIGDATGDPAAAQLLESLAGIADVATVHPVCRMRDAALSLRDALSEERTRPPRRDGMRLAIYGLLEARLMQADLVILGGLNEGVWPKIADPGPWVNRSMRAALGMQSPERETGITAHDFAMGLSHPRVVLTWSQRISSEPVVPSRFVLRLRVLLEMMGQKKDQQLIAWPIDYAQRLDKPSGFSPHLHPRPNPPIETRPRRFSVTEIERLRRDPYEVYARRVLTLQPLQPINMAPDARLRGTLFHDAIGRWLAAGDVTLTALNDAGTTVFAPYMSTGEIRFFWWPKFLRMAEALVHLERELGADVAQRFVEIAGSHAFEVAGVPHVLSARADRIDILSNGTLRIVDYKTGAPPSSKTVKAGLAPQLTLEAAIAAKSKFGEQVAGDTSELLYIQVSGNTKAAELKPVLSAADIAVVREGHFVGLVKLLARYQDPAQPYLSRAAMESDEQPSDFDHLARFREWALGG